MRFAALLVLIAALGAGVLVLRMNSDDGVTEQVALPSAEDRSRYVELGLIPASLPEGAEITSILRNQGEENSASISFELSARPAPEWLARVLPTRPMPGTEASAPDRVSGQTQGSVSIIAWGDFCDGDQAWRYTIAESGAGLAQNVTGRSGACLAMETAS